MRRALAFAAALMAAILLALLGCSSDTPMDEGDDGDNGGGDVGMAYEIPPFDVVRHSVNLNGVWMDERAVITVGDSGMVFVRTQDGRFILPNPYIADMTDAWMSNSGIIFLTDKHFGFKTGYVYRYTKGTRYIHGVAGTMDSGDATALHGHGEDAYAVSSIGEVHHFNGVQWDYKIVTPDEPLNDIWTDDEGVAFAAGVGGIYWGAGGAWELFHLFPAAFQRVTGLTRDKLMALHDNDIVMYDGTNWSMSLTSDVALNDVDWISAGTAIAVGDAGVTWRYDGAAWEKRTMTPAQNINAVSGKVIDNARVAVAVGDSGAVYGYVDGFWTGRRSRALDWSDVMGASASVAYGIYRNRLMRWDEPQKEWTQQVPVSGLDLTDLWCVDVDDVWAVGSAVGSGGMDKYVAHYDGSSWSSNFLTSMDQPSDIWADSPTAVYVCADYGTVYATPGSWAPQSVIQPVQHLRGVWGAAWNHVYVVGENGTIVFFDGTSWTPMPSGTTEHLNAIDGSNSTNILAVGDNGTMLHYDGTAWTPVATGIDEDITMVSVRYVMNMWAATSEGTVLHYDGTSWETMHTGLRNVDHKAISAEGGSGVWIVCDRDFVLRHAVPPQL